MLVIKTSRLIKQKHNNAIDMITQTRLSDWVGFRAEQKNKSKLFD